MVSSKIYREGKLFPPETEIAETLGISRATVRQAINKLVQEGLLTRKKGVGTCVARRGFSSKASNWMSFTQEMQQRGISVRNYAMSVSWVKANDTTAQFFNCPEDSLILRLERLRGNQEYPFVRFISYFNPGIGLTGEENFTRPLYEILSQDFGVDVKTSLEEISASAADRQLAEAFSIPEGSPILVRERRVLDTNDKPVEYNIGYYRADSFVYSIECKR